MDSEFDLPANFAKFRLHGTRDRRPWTSEGQKMIRIIGKITAESKKAGYNPKNDTNWCHLPMELREKCIKKMDFMTRTRMRRSSRIEKSYVDAYIYHFDKLIFQSTRSITLKLFKSNPFFQGGEERIILALYPEDHLRKIPPFKFCDFKEIQCYAKGGNLPDVLNDWESKCAPFRFKTLRCKGGNFEIYKYFLKNSWDGVEELFLDVKQRDNFEIDDVLCPSFSKATKIVIENVPFNKIEFGTIKIIESWMEHDVEIGTMCHLHSGKIGEPVNGEERQCEPAMINESKAVYLETNIHIGGAAEVIIKIVPAPIPGPTDAPNGN